jgi:hypothetical protein
MGRGWPSANHGEVFGARRLIGLVGPSHHTTIPPTWGVAPGYVEVGLRPTGTTVLTLECSRVSIRSFISRRKFLSNGDLSLIERRCV